MTLIDRLLGTRRRRPDATALYQAVIDRARAPHWYLGGGVPDSVEGRFEMISAVLALVLIRLEADPAAEAASVVLTECFITDMDAQLREAGVGDVGLGKQVGTLVSMLGGRLGAYRDGLAAGDLTTALVRNLYRGAPPLPQAVEHSAAELTRFAAALAQGDTAALLAGQLP